MDEEIRETLSGIPLPDLASFEGLTEIGANPDLIGLPGQPPWTRGIHSTMYRGRKWTMRQYAGFSSAEATNTRFRTLLERGQKGLSVAFDLPTQIGMDSNAPLADGEVGRVGVAIDTVEDMKRLFDGIPLDAVSTSMTINAPAAILLAMYVVTAEEMGVDTNRLSGTIQNDILKEYIARGTWIFGPSSSMRLITDTISWCAKHMPNWNPISISGYHIREAGATAPEEVGLTLANGLAYVEASIAAGLTIDDFAPRLSFFFNAQNDFFEEISKFRAARKLWHDLVSSRFSPANPHSTRLRFHTQVAGAALTAQQPLNNITRVTIQALAAVLGGTQSLHTNSYDEAIGLPTEEAATVALRTQQIIAEESGVADSVDPMAGSILVEHLTQKIEEEARLIIERIEDHGGAIGAISAGFPQKMIHDSAWRHLMDVEAGGRKVIGVNHGLMEEKDPIESQSIDSNVATLQGKRIEEVCSERDSEEVKVTLGAVTKAAGGKENILPPILAAVRARATLGEIVDAMKSEFGTYEAPTGI